MREEAETKIALHDWNVAPTKAVEIQRRLAASVVETPLRAAVHRIAGVDCAFSRDGRHCLAAAVVWDLRSRSVVEEVTARRPARFPYVPGLLSFREAPAVLAALGKLSATPDVIVCDGQGRAHPRRLGLACHVGLWLDLPALGCAKSRLVGEHRQPGSRRGCRTRLVDRDETIGAVLRTRDGVRPVYVSVGHRLTLDDAVRIALRCGAGYRLPEPTRLADRLVAEYKRRSG